MDIYISISNSLHLSIIYLDAQISHYRVFVSVGQPIEMTLLQA